MCILTETFCVDKIILLCHLHFSAFNTDFEGCDLALDASVIHNLFIIASSLKKKIVIHISPTHLGTKVTSPPHYLSALIWGYNYKAQSDLLP